VGEAGGSASTRERILDAATSVMRARGMARATTKEIARAAELSEAALYKHFPSKEDLLLRVLRERMPQFIDLVAALPERVGERTVEAQLVELARYAVSFYEQSMDLLSSLFAEPALLLRHRQGLVERGLGPHLAIEGVARYLREEQRIGRIDAQAAPEAAAALLLGACYQRAFLSAFMGVDQLIGSHDEYAEDTVRTLLAGIAPR
jgi:AcrR family transcriptional regulator